MIRLDGYDDSPKVASRQFRDRLTGQPNKFRVLAGARSGLPKGLIPTELRWLSRQPRLVDLASLASFPASVARLSEFGPFPPIPIDREIRWATAWIEANGPHLTTLLEAKAAFELELFGGSPTKACELLEATLAQHGYSYWWVKSAIAAHQLARGIDSHKQLASALKNAVGAWTVTGYIIHNLSVLNEPSVTAPRFIATTSKEIESFTNLTKAHHDHLRYHLIGGWPSSPQAAMNILRVSARDSVLDLYLSLLHLGRVLLTWDAPAAERLLVSHALARLADVVRDHTSATLASVLRPIVEDEPPPHWLHELPATPPCLTPHTYVLAAEAEREVGATSPDLSPVAQEFMQAVSAALHKAGDVEAAIAGLVRFKCTLGSSPHVALASAIALKEVTGTPLPDDDSTSSNERDDLARELAFGLAHAPASWSALIAYLPLSFLPRLLQWLDTPGSTPGIQASVQRALGQLGCHPSQATDAELLLTARGALHKGNLEECISLADRLIATTNSFYVCSGLRLKAHCLVRLRRMGECITFTVATVVSNECLRYVMPIRHIVDSLDRDQRRALMGSIELPLMYDLYGRFVDGAMDATRRSAVAAFLQANGVQRPSQLFANGTLPTSPLLIYFAHRLCVPEVLFASGDYPGSRDVVEERVKVLQWLREHNPDHAVDYQTEIVERVRRAALQQRRIEVEASRIYVDYHAFLREAERTAREPFERYLALRKAGLPSRVLAERDTRRTSSPEGIAPTLSVPIPKDEVGELLGAIVSDLAAAFIGNRLYGLDGTLSTRVRHGVLENELRSSLLRSHLVTSLDQSRGVYLPNEYWAPRLSSAVTPAEAQAIDSRLATFSSEFDALVREIRMEWIQVRRSHDGTGMIDLRITEDLLHRCDALIGPMQPTFGAFANAVFLLFLSLLEPSLASIRTRLDTDGKQRARTLLTQLGQDLEGMGIRVTVPALLNAVHGAATGVERAFDRVQSWLHVATAVELEPLPLRDAVEIAVEIAQRFNAAFHADLTVDALADASLQGTEAALLIDVLLILFDNAMRHGGLVGAPRVSVHASREQEVFAIAVANALGASVDIGVCSERLGEAMEAIAAGVVDDASTDESGTGLLRVHAMISKYMKIDPQLSARVDGRKCRIQFSIPVGGHT